VGSCEFDESNNYRYGSTGISEKIINKKRVLLYVVAQFIELPVRLDKSSNYGDGNFNSSLSI